MAIVPRAERITPTEAAQLVAVNVCTIWRWIQRGVRGHRLQTFSYGGRRYILREDLEAFLHNDKIRRDDSDAHRRAEEAGKLLDGLGVRCIAASSEPRRRN